MSEKLQHAKQERSAVLVEICSATTLCRGAWISVEQPERVLNVPVDILQRLFNGVPKGQR